MPDALIGSRIEKLQGVHPRLVEAVKRILYAMNELGLHMVVTDGVRTTAEQQALYASGRTVVGKVVTYADGVEQRSNHQVTIDGFGHAVDLAFVDAHGQPTWAESMPWPLYAEMAKALGLVWGGDFQRLPDKPHVELPPEQGIH